MSDYKTNAAADNAAAKKEKNEHLVKLSKEYNFEGETISEIDLSGMENLTAESMIKAEKVLTSNGMVSVMPEMNIFYSLVIASEATGKPIEFFKKLKPVDASKVKNRVTAFFFGTESE